MESIRATIYDGEEPVGDDLDGFLEVVVAEVGRLKSWFGCVALPWGSQIRPGGPFSLVLADGRRGQIIVNRL